MATIKGLLNLLLAPLLAWGWYENLPDIKAWALFLVGMIWAGVQIWEKYWTKRKAQAEAQLKELELKEKRKKKSHDTT